MMDTGIAKSFHHLQCLKTNVTPNRLSSWNLAIYRDGEQQRPEYKHMGMVNKMLFAYVYPLYQKLHETTY